ncbi:MAG: flagellar export chaperone FliS [bacterium]
MAIQLADHQGTRNPYLRQQLKTASPEKLILMLFDLGVKRCRARDRTGAARVLVELIAALNFDHKEIALTFFQLYRFALDQVHSQKFENALMIFEGLRDVWESAVLGCRDLEN